MGFGRIIGYIFSIIWILVSIPFIAVYGIGLLMMIPPIAIIIVLRRQAKREVRMEGYQKSQADSLERMTNPLGLTMEEQEALNEHKEKERRKLEKEERKRGMPKIDYTVIEDDTDIDTDTDKKPRPRSITENLDIDNVTGNKEFEQDKIFCRFCGKSIPSSSHYCPICGKNILSHPNQTQRCGICNITMSVDSQYCAGCGTKVMNETEHEQINQVKIFCRFCGKSISTLGDYCPMCGKNLGSHPNQKPLAESEAKRLGEKTEPEKIESYRRLGELQRNIDKKGYVEDKEEKGRKKSKDLTPGLQDASNIAYGASYVTDVQNISNDDTYDNDDDYDDEE